METSLELSTQGGNPLVETRVTPLTGIEKCSLDGPTVPRLNAHRGSDSLCTLVTPTSGGKLSLPALLPRGEALASLARGEIEGCGPSSLRPNRPSSSVLLGTIDRGNGFERATVTTGEPRRELQRSNR